MRGIELLRSQDDVVTGERRHQFARIGGCGVMLCIYLRHKAGLGDADCEGLL